MADFSKINDEVQQQLSSQAPAPAPAPAPPSDDTPPAPPAPPTALELANARIAELERERATEHSEHEERERTLRLDKAAALAHKPLQNARGNVQQDMAFDELRRTVKGNCFMQNLTSAQKLEGIGIFGTESIKDSVIKTYFGPGSDSAAANALYRSDRERYNTLRAVAIARGLY